MKQITPRELTENAFELFAQDWALLSASNHDKTNCMTISWGGFGHLWNKDIAYVYVRPTRYTYEFIENTDSFILTFLKDGYREDLTYLGKTSGRLLDKVGQTKLTPTSIHGYQTFEQAKYVVVCKKAYVSDIQLDSFVDDDVKSVYKDNNLHRQYIGIIEQVYQNF